MNTPERRTKRRVAEAERRAQLTDTYVRDTITKHRAYDGHPVTAAEIQAKREQLIAWRTTATCQCGAPTAHGASLCVGCRRAARRAAVSDAYVRQAIRKLAAKAGRPIPAGQEIPAAEIEARRQSILASRAHRNSPSGTSKTQDIHIKKGPIELSDRYVLGLIKGAVGYDGHEITQEEIEARRQKLAAGRAAGRVVDISTLPAACQCGAPLKRHRRCAGCRKKAERESLADTYVRRHIWRVESRQGLPRREVPPHEIEAVRQQLRAMREATPRR